MDPYGRVTAQSALFEQTALVGEVRLLTSRTVYGQIGDAVAWVACGLTVMALFLARRHAA